MKTVAHTLEQLDTTLDTVELLIRELPLSMRQEARLIDMLYDMYETAESAVSQQLEVDIQLIDAIL
jgi:hypothetical protein